MSVITHYVDLSSGDLLAFTAPDEDALGYYANAETDIAWLQKAISENTVQAIFRVYVLYPDETVAYEIPRERIKAGGSYNENYQNGQRRTLSFTVYNEDGQYTPNINQFWVGTKLRLDMGLSLPSGNSVWFQKGIFVITSAAPSKVPGAHEVNISASDKYCLFEQGRGVLGTTYTVPVNTDIYGLISSILFTDGGNGYLLDSTPFLFNRALETKKTQAEITKSAGDNLASILSDIAMQINAEIFYNSTGQLVFAPIPEVTADINKPILYHYETVKGDLSQLDFSLDYANIQNRVVVIGTSSSGGTFTYVAANDDAASPLCWQRIGYRTGEIITDTNIYSMQLAKERAEYELRQRLILTSSVNLTIMCNPFLSVNNLITISDEFYGLNREKFLIQSVGCSLDFSNQMQLSVTNVRNLPFLT